MDRAVFLGTVVSGELLFDVIPRKFIHFLPMLNPRFTNGEGCNLVACRPFKDQFCSWVIFLGPRMKRFYMDTDNSGKY